MNDRELFEKYVQLLKDELSRADCNLYNFAKRISCDFNCSMNEASNILERLDNTIRIAKTEKR